MKATLEAAASAAFPLVGTSCGWLLNNPIINLMNNEKLNFPNEESELQSENSNVASWVGIGIGLFYFLYISWHSEGLLFRAEPAGVVVFLFLTICGIVVLAFPWDVGGLAYPVIVSASALANLIGNATCYLLLPCIATYHGAWIVAPGRAGSDFASMIISVIGAPLFNAIAGVTRVSLACGKAQVTGVSALRARLPISHAFRVLLYPFAVATVSLVIVIGILCMGPILAFGPLFRSLRYTVFTSEVADEESLENYVRRPLEAYVEELTTTRNLPASYVKELHALIEITYILSRVTQVGERAANKYWQQTDDLFIQHQTHLDPPGVVESKSTIIESIYSRCMSCSWKCWFLSVVYVDLFYHHIPELFYRVDQMEHLLSAFVFFAAHWVSIIFTALNAHFPCCRLFREINLCTIRCYMACDADFQQLTVLDTRL